AVSLHKAVEVAIKPAGTHLGVNLLCKSVPGPGLVAVSFLLELFGNAIACDPCHHLGVNEVLGLAAGLPDAFVRLPPCCREMFEQHWSERPGVLGGLDAGL